MRTTKRFTPKVLARFQREGRGEGTHADYVPWHKVSRGDPASSGRSHLLKWQGRLRELLSDGEYCQQLFATMLPGVVDCREQLKLDLHTSPHVLREYEHQGHRDLQPGTLEIAESLSIRHPMLRDRESETPWVPTTDLLLVYKEAKGHAYALAIAFKPDGELESPRKRQLLNLEREYWRLRGVTWLLITPAVYNIQVRLTLQRTACWALDEAVANDLRQRAADIARTKSHASLTEVLNTIALELGNLTLAQRALWQAIWNGELPVDLRRGWRPHTPLEHITTEAFWSLNPIASRRSAWN